MSYVIPLSQDKMALVDEEDWLRCMQYCWTANYTSGIWYAKRSHPTVLLHRFILKIDDPNILVDHENRDGLDCRKCNMRLATPSQNTSNQIRLLNGLGYRGVKRHRRKFEAAIYYDGKYKWLGLYSSLEEAAKAYDEAAIRLHGEFAVLNFGRQT